MAEDNVLIASVITVDLPLGKSPIPPSFVSVSVIFLGCSSCLTAIGARKTAHQVSPLSHLPQDTQIKRQVTAQV